MIAVGLFGIILVSLLVSGMLFGIFGARRGAAIIAGILLLIGLGLLFMARTVQVPRAYGPTPGPMLGTPVSPASPGAPWLPALDDTSSPQTPFVSASTLQRYVVERTLTAVNEVKGDATEARVVDEDNPLGLRKPLSEGLQKSFGVANRSEQPEPPDTRPSEEVWVSFRWQNHQRVSVDWASEPMERGTVIVDVTGPAGSATVTADLDEKPWVRNTYPYLGTGAHGYWVAASAGASSSEAEARNALREAALLHTVQLLRARAEASVSSSGRLSDGALRAQAEAAMVNDDAVVDECIVRIDKVYGPVWYAAALRDTRVKSLDHTVDAAVVQHTGAKRSFAEMVVALGGMMLVLAVVYAGLNALTRGYFQLHLRTAIAVVLVIAVTVILLLKG